MGLLFSTGLMIACGFFGGKISGRLKFPSVVGYLIAGLILGPSFFNIFKTGFLDSMGPFNDLALGIVAFIIGSEMQLSVLRKLGKGIMFIILSESLMAFSLVFLGVYLFTHQIHLALIFGAMAPASAPAGTAVVLREYKAKGPLTNALYAVVGLDDGLAIMIYAFAAALAKMTVTGKTISLLNVIKVPMIEICGAVILGLVFGWVLGFVVRNMHNRKEVLSVSLAAIMVSTGIANHFHLSLILTNLTIGIIFGNLYFYANKRAVETLDGISLPIYTIFFVIAGAHLQISLLPAMGLLGIIYIVCRTLGLVGGAYFGCTVTKAESVLRKYLGFGILSQAGVAIGLSIMATRDFSSLGEVGSNLSLLVVNTIAATTIVFEIIGPIATKYAIRKAGEIGKEF